MRLYSILIQSEEYEEDDIQPIPLEWVIIPEAAIPEYEFTEIKLLGELDPDWIVVRNEDPDDGEKEPLPTLLKTGTEH
jgi:hypothetical protein